VYAEWRTCARELEELERNEQEKLRLLDLWSFQRNEIEAARLKPAEDEELAAERRVLQNVTRLADGANAAWSALYDAPESAWAQVRHALRRLEDLARVDESLAGVLETLRPAAISLEDASATLRDYLAKLEADPDRLEQVEARLAAIDRLKRKYGSTVDEILAFLDDVKAKLTAIETTTERRAALEKDRARLASRYEALAADLSSRRAEAARKLERQVESELKSLAMERTIFRIELTPADWSPRGTDAVRFLVSPNLGEEPRPLEKVASGGELSRIALALKTCVSGAAKRTAATPRTLVFDEVDAGIGGGAAESVGRRLKRLAGSNQVLCVTHLAQIAGFADHHYAVEKRETRGRTVAEIDELQGEARTREIGRMLSGRVTPEALKHAEQLLKTGAEQKR
jgi:DNA repair protein RecN (Recombination protein N)